MAEPAVGGRGTSPAVRIGRALGQVVAYAAFAAFVGYFAGAPAYSGLAPGYAQIKLSFSHAGQPEQECRRRSASEIAALPPNMRRPTECPRRRVALRVELDLDGAPLYRAGLPPSGLAGDGAATVYQRFAVPAGAHRLSARLRDSRRARGFDYRDEVAFELAPGQHYVVRFDATRGGFEFPG